MKYDSLRPQDLLVTMKLAVFDDENFSYESLGESLGNMPPSAVHSSVERARGAALLFGKKKKRSRGNLKVNRLALAEFMIHGAKYAFPAGESMAKIKGMPTADAIGIINEQLAPSDHLHWVWPDDEGEEGYFCNPIHKNAVEAAKEDAKLYELLALLDSQRVGDARVKRIGADAIKEKLQLT